METGSRTYTGKHLLQWQDIEALQGKYALSRSFDPQGAQVELRQLFDRFNTRRGVFNPLSESLYSLSQLQAPSYGSEAYRDLQKKIKEEAKKNRSFEDFDFFGPRFKVAFFLVQLALFCVAVFFALGLDWIFPTPYHLLPFLLFALLYRLCVLPLERYLFIRMARQLFEAGLAYLFIQLMQRS